MKKIGKIEHLPYPLGSLVLYRGGRCYITRIHKYTGNYDLVVEEGRVKIYCAEHKDVTLLFPPTTVCDWQKMLDACLK